MVRPPQQSRSEQNLAKMVTACRALAEERGNLDDIALNDVVSAAKTSIGAFYSRFKDKEAFLNYVLEVALVDAEQATRRSIAQDPVWQAGPAHAIVAQIARLYLTQFRENRGLFRGSLRHYAVRDPEMNPMRTANRRIIGLAVPWLARQFGDRSGEAAAFEARAAIQFLVGTLSNVLLNDPGPLHLDDDAIEIHLVRMMNRYLGVPEAVPAKASRRRR
jgi:AcrR family transcriptional regulator